jgi:FkbM family methyltransferase
VNPLEIAIKRIFDDNGWDFAGYASLIADAPFDRILLLNGGHPVTPSNFGGLHVREWMRFGNSVVQLSNLAALCRKYPIPAVYFEEEHPFFDVARLSETTGVPFVRRGWLEFVITDGLVLSGQFFFAEPYRLFADLERQELIDQHLSVLLPEGFIGGHPLVHDSTITMHFRAGDIFASDGAGANYGQPPLAYYKLVLDHSSAERVVVVFEDLGNPTIEPFAEYARSRGREVIMQSADLHSDLAVLFNSPELVGGIGSFLWAVHALSKRLRQFWFFERVFDRSAFARPHIALRRVSDVEGGYVKAILSGNWARRSDQLQLMVDYPVSALAIDGAAPPSPLQDEHPRMDISIDLLDSLGISAGQAYEDLLQALISQLVVPGSIAVDGGANTGMHTPLMARRVAPSGHVFAFEPQLEVCRANRDGIASMRLTDYVTHFAAALGDAPGRATFFAAARTDAFSSFSHAFVANTLRQIQREEETINEITVDVVALDSIPDLRRLDFLKLDLEGAEFLALRGAIKLLSSSDCFIYWEGGRGWSGELFGYTRDEFFEFFDKIGYEPYTAFGKRLTREDWTDPQVGWYFYAHRADYAHRATVERVVSSFWGGLTAGARKIAAATAKPAPREQIVGPVFSVPHPFISRFTMQGHVPIQVLFFDESHGNQLHWTRAEYEHNLALTRQAIDSETRQRYAADVHLARLLKRHAIDGQSVLIIGSAAPFYEAFAAHFGGIVSTVEYRKITHDIEGLRTFTVDELVEAGLEFDCGISISSIEHSGLGRYGDPIDPDGDLKAMQLYKRHIKKGGYLFLEVPLGLDTVVWNAHRIYGQRRLPLLMRGWQVVDSDGFDEAVLTRGWHGEYLEQAVFLLRND